MRTVWQAAALMMLLGAAGCMTRHPLAEGELDRYWSLHPVRWHEAEPATLKVGGRPIPTHWLIRQDPSFLRSTISLVRAADRLKTGTDEVAFSLSPEHAAMAAKMLADARKAIVNFRKAMDPDSHPSMEQWASATASTIADAERIVRLSTAEDPDRPAKEGEEPAGLSAEPLLNLAMAYLNERAGGLLLADMNPQDVGRLREALAQMVLRLAFAAAGKQDPPDLRETVASAMREADDPDSLRKALPETLLAHLREAPPAPPSQGLASVSHKVLAWAPRMLRVLEMVVLQWDRMESLAVEFRRAGDEPLVQLTLNVSPGREVRIADQFIMQPALVFRGSSRILIVPKPGGGDELAVLFEPGKDAAGQADDGATEVRFEGLGWGLVRVLALPLASAALREIRVSAGTQEDQSLLSVLLLMEATGDRNDPRRLIAFQDVREKRLVREPFEVRSETERLRQVFNYVTPQGRYTYRRVKTPDAP
ncbi:MAG TPA: hypothetical protein VFH53_10725 [Phycisphaerae bacterium]|nr:hypothetical protein [Phycisphaerae bacterium]